ncbi:hypothetical protein ACLOJK_040572 [Asimina triloba]
MALAGLNITQLLPLAATQSTFIEVEGFEGEYGGINFSNEEATLKEAFEGFDGASEGGSGRVGMFTKAIEQIKGPQMYIVEEINAEFLKSLLARVGLRGIINLRTIPPRPTVGAMAEIEEEAQFSFGIEGTTGIKRVVIHGTHMSNVGNGMFHVRARLTEDPVPLLKYSLQPKHTLLPLRVHLL